MRRKPCSHCQTKVLKMQLVISGMRVVHVFGLPYAEVACAAPFFQNMPTLVTITIN